MKAPLFSRTPVLLALWLAALFAATLALDLRHRDFAWYYHPDEDSKIDQVISGKWNFNHPMLLLQGARVVVEVQGTPKEPQAVVEAGRAVSAFFMAAAVAALAALAWVWRGWTASLCAGGALMFHHQLFELSHYMKEDGALLCGLSMAWLAVLCFERKPTPAMAAVLGLACALAGSGKYVGFVALVAAVPVLWRAGGRANAGAFCVALIAGLAAINWPMLANWSASQASLARESGYVLHGQKGVAPSVPHSEYWSAFVDNSTPAMWVLLLACFVARWRERRTLTPGQRHMVLFPLVYALVLSFSPKANDRYFLPASALLTVLAAIGVEDAARLLAGRLRFGWGCAVAGAFLVLGQAPSWWRYERAFQRDDSVELQQWVRANLPKDAVLAKDSRVWLPDSSKPSRVPADVIPQKVLAAKFVADLGTIEELRAKGVTHVVLSESDYGRFFRDSLKPQAGKEAEYHRRKAFYESILQSRQSPLLDLERSTVIYLHPGIRVYPLPEAPGQPAQPPAHSN